MDFNPLLALFLGGLAVFPAIALFDPNCRKVAPVHLTEEKRRNR